MGHSMGGIITNIYATIYDNFDGAIILAAPMESPNLGPFNFLPYKLFGFLRFKTDYKDERLSHFPPSDNVDPYALKYFTLRLVGDLMKTGMKYFHKNISNYTKPILVLHGTEDKLVPYQQSENFIKKIPAKDKTLKLIEGGYHNLNHDTVTDEVGKEIVAWLDQKTA